MSKIGQPTGPRTPGEQPKVDDNKLTGNGGGNARGADGATNLGPNKRVMSAEDIERLASQAGFTRGGGRKKHRNFDLGDSSQAPIPLPEDDLDSELGLEASAENLELAGSQLLHHGAQLGRSRGRGGGRLEGLWQAIVAGDAGDEMGEGEEAEARLAARSQQLKALPTEPGPDAEAMAKVTRSMAEQFGIDLQAIAVGPQLMAASLLVAGQQSDVAMAANAPQQIDAERLVQGAGRVIEAGRQAADDARSRAAGMQRNLNVQRTFVPKR